MESLNKKHFTQISLQRKDIFEIIKDAGSNNNSVLIALIEHHLTKILGHPINLCADVKSALRKLFCKFRKKLQDCNRNYERFFKINKSWLEMDIYLCDKPKNSSAEPSTSAGIAGRPSCSFEGSSERTKRRRTKTIREQHEIEELAYALQMNFRASGNVDAAKVVKEIAEGSPSTATRYKDAVNNVREKQMTNNEALSLIIENKLSKNMYNNIRAASVQHNCKLYPSYKNVLEAKKHCYPCTTDMTITECSAEVKLQALLDHTIQRILLVQKDVFRSLTGDVYNFNLICKWGCDGTSGQSSFKQKFADDTDGDKTDANIFFISLVPLQIVSVDKSMNKEIIIWKNPRPSSPRFCRPIKIEFMHETAESTRLLVDGIKEQERNLTSYEAIVDGKEINVNYILSLTMIDGKVCNSLTSTTSSQRCYLCHCTSKQFNNIDDILTKPINEDNLQFGISSLHAWIRFFECLLHISYKLDIKKWQNRGEDKHKIETRKKNIQKGFRQQLGLLVDQPKEGYGSTNDGNTARRFFENATISAAITGLDETLIKKFHVVLQVITCGFDVDVPKYEQYCLETARSFVFLYPWFYMPTTVHKILIHSGKIIQASLLPIGQMSEEAQESCNKFIKKYRQDFARKCSRVKNMEDVFLRLLVSSDPLISSLRKLPVKRLKALESEAVELLKAPSAEIHSSDEESMNSSDEEY